MIQLSKFIPVLLVALLWISLVSGTDYSGLKTIGSSVSVLSNKQGPNDRMINSSLVLIEGADSSYVWNLTSNTQKTSFPSNAGGNTPLGVFLDNARVFYNTTQTLTGIMCFADKDNSVLTVSYVANFSNTPTTTKVWATTGEAPHTCFVDYKRGNLWVYGRAGGILYKVPLKSNPTQMLTATGNTVSYNLQGRASAINSRTDTAYIACDSAKLIVVPLNLTTLTTPLTILNVGVSNLRSIAIDQAQNYMFLGTDIGIGLKYTIGKWLEVQLFFIVGSPDLTGTLLHTDRNVSYWMADNGNVYRVNYDGFNFNMVYDSVTLSATGFPVAGGFLNPSDVSIGFFIVGNSSYNMWKTKLFDCSVHTSCESCSQDPYYCGWCASAGQCTLQGNCTTGPQFTDIDSCPVLTSLTPVNGSSLGGTRITISGNYFPGSTEKCRFSDGVKKILTPKVADVTSGSTIIGIQCDTPVGNFSRTTVDVDVVFTSSNISLTTNNLTLPFTYYNCSVATNCASCPLVGSECGWCMATATCSNTASCPTSLNSSTVIEFSQSPAQCPSITDVFPSNGVVDGGTNVTITGGQFIPTLSYSCLFGQTNTSAATLVNLTTLTCVSPANPTGSEGSIQNVSIVYRNQTNKVYARGGFFIYYNCQTSNSCAVCLSGVCQWCLETATCGALNTSCSYPVTQVCPVITGITPDQTFLSNPVNVFVNGTFFPANNFSSQFECRFQNSTYSRAVNATYYNSTTVSCLSPSTFSSQVVDIVMYYKNKTYAPQKQEFEYYSCTAPSCSACVQLDRPECGWCAVDNQCKIISNSTCSGGGAPLQSCPVITSIDPNFGLITGNRNVTVTFAQGLPSGNTFYCNFQGNYTNATLVGPSTLLCEIPPRGVTGQIDFSVDVGANPYSANTVPFYYKTCQDLSNNCDQCQMVDCDWCIPNSCLDPGSPSCFAALSTCPTLNQLSPDHSELSGADVDVEGSGFVNIGFVYTVSVSQGAVNNTGPCTYVNSNTLDCLFPPFNYTATTSAVIMGNGAPFLLSNLTYFYHDCHDQTTCGDCLEESSFCGWCVETSSCSQSSECSQTFVQTCPVVTLEHNYADIQGGNPVRAVSSQGLFSSSVALECVWEGIATVPAARVNSSMITCDSPVVSNATTVTFLIEYANTSIPFFDTPTSFDFIDCNYTISTQTEYPCSVCSNLAETRCTWCLRDNYCGPSYMCSAEALANVNQCPFITGLNPLSGETDGGDTVTLTGVNFIDTQALKCTFENGKTHKHTSIAYKSSNSITCKTPSWSEARQISMQLTLNDTAFSNSLAFTYEKGSKQNTVGIVVGSVIGAVVFLGLVGALVAFLVLRKRGPAALKLVEPNYAAVAFAGNMLSFKLTKSDLDHMEAFKQLLLRQDLSLAIAMMNATKVTESDRIAKALCYVFSSAYQTVPLLIATIQEEVNIAAKSPGGRETLFRSNSMATKIFTQYAKIVGLKYLWETLARAVAELAALGKEKDTAPDRDSSSMSIMRLDSFEVDPTRMDDLDESDLAINQLQLMLICQKVFTGIMKSVDAIPQEIREVMRIIKKQVGEVYPESTYIGMGGFFFLRFICPAMTAPHVYGLLSHPPNEETQRYLVLLSKALQNLANNTLPGAKETYMQKMNDFITSNQSKLIHFFDQMVAGEDYNSNNNNNSSSAKGSALAVPKQQEEIATATLYAHTYKESKAVYANLNDANAKDVSSALASLFADGAPPEQIKP